MTGFVIGAFSALWLGLLTSISPCPLATNIAAISFIARNVNRPRLVFLTGLFYTIGRVFAYIVLGSLLVTSVLSIPQLSYFLQKYMNKLLGPVLILAGMVLLNFIQINFGGSGLSEKTQKQINSLGIWGAGLLGIIFALSFCPVSAAVFFWKPYSFICNAQLRHCFAGDIWTWDRASGVYILTSYSLRNSICRQDI